jgi:hypothetical protein
LAKLKLLNEPIATLAPGRELRTYYDNHIDRNARDGLPSVHQVSLTYKDTSKKIYRKRL